MGIDIRSKLKLIGDQGKPNSLDPRSKFQKRTTEVLERTYEERGKRTKSTGMGRTIWDKEKLEKFGIEEFNCLKNGNYFIEALPLSFDPSVSYGRELSVHFQVGFAGDHFICLHRYHGAKCYRCEQQAKLFREMPRIPGQKLPDHVKALYPNDRMGYMLWDRTTELLNGESPSSIISIWNMPKKKVHEEIQSRVRDKITRSTLDISDMYPGGDGRTISFEVTMEGTFPQYKGFDLNQRPSPITTEIADKLGQVITAASAEGHKNAIDYLLHIPTYDEVKTSMLTEGEEEAPAPDHQSIGGAGSLAGTIKMPSPRPAAQHMNTEEITQMLITKYEALQARLSGMNTLQWRIWLKSEGKEFAEDVDTVPQADAISMIIEFQLEEECLKYGIKM